MSTPPLKGRLLSAMTPGEVFKVVEKKERAEVVKIVNQNEVSLGMVDPVTGR